MKKCADCKVEKHETEFYLHKQQTNGRNPYCIVCVKSQNAERYRRNKEKYALRQKEYYQENKEQIKARTKEWVKENQVRKKIYDKEYYANLNPDQLEKALERKRIFDKTEKGKEASKKYRQGPKWVARYTFRNAIRDGKIQKVDNCSLCDSTLRVEGHHKDYSKPLEVVWLCRKCHSAIHKSLKEREADGSKRTKKEDQES